MEIAEGRADGGRFSDKPPDGFRERLGVNLSANVSNVAGIGDRHIGQRHRIDRDGSLGDGQRKMGGFRRE